MNEELQGIIQSMIDKGETQESINMAIAEYEKTNNSDIQEGKQPAAAEETAPVVAETPVDTDLQSEDGSSELQKPVDAFVAPVSFIPRGFQKGVAKFLSVTVPEAIDLGLPITGATSRFDNAQKFQNIIESVKQGKRFTKRKDGKFDIINISGGIDRYNSLEEFEKDYSEKSKQEARKGAEKFIESQEYRKIAKIFGEDPKVLDGLTMGEFSELLGTQGGQMISAGLTLGLSTYAQEAGGMLKEIVETKVKKKYPSFDKLSDEQKQEKIIEIVENGEIDFSKIENSAAGIAAVDFISNAIGIGKLAAKPAGSLFRNLLNKNYKGAVKALKGDLGRVAEASLFEVPTELTQELISDATVSKQLGEDFEMDPNQMAEVAAQTLISTGGLVGSGRVVNRAARNIVKNPFKGNVKEQVNAQKEAIDIVYNSKLSNIDKLNSPLQEEAKAKAKQQRDSELTALYEAESIAGNSNYRNFEPEAKEKMFDIQIEQQILNNKNKELQNTYTGESVLSSGQINANNEKIAELEAEKLKVIGLQVKLNEGNGLRSYINSNPKEFNGYSFLSFKTKKEAEEYIESQGIEKDENVQALINGDAYAIKIPGKKLAIDVKETSEKGAIGIGANAVHHEALHMINEGISDDGLQNTVSGIKEFIGKSQDETLKAIVKYAENRVKTDYADASQRIQNEEFIGSISDMMRQYQIETGNVQGATALSKLGDRIARFISKKGPKDFDYSKLENPAEVVNFLRKYNSFNGKHKLGLKLNLLQDGKVDIEDTEKETLASKSNLQGLLDEADGNKTMFINNAMTDSSGDFALNMLDSKFGKEVAPILEDLAKKRFDPIPEDATAVVSENRLDARKMWKEDLLTELITEVSNKYKPGEQDLDRFVTIRAFQRSNRTAKNIGIQSTIEQGGQGIAVDITEAKGIMADEPTQQATESTLERLNIEDKISEDIGKLSEMATIQAEKTISNKKVSDLKKLNARNKTFGDIFAKRLFNDIKNVLSKNTKTKSDFSEFLNNNYEALSDIVLNYIDFQKGTGLSSVWSLENKPNKEDFIEYYEGKDVKISTRADRKKSLNNAIARAIANDARIKLAEDNPSLNEDFKKATNISLASRVGYDLFLDESLTMPKMLKAQKVNLDGVKISSLATEKDIIKYFDYQEKSVWPSLPKNFVIFTQENTSNQYTSNSGKGLLTEANEGEIRRSLRPFFYKEAKERINSFDNFGPDILIDGEPVQDYKNKNYSSIQKPLERIAAGNATLDDNETINAFNKRNKAIGKEIYTRFNKAIQDDKQNAIGIAAFLNLATNNTEHFNRALAEVVGISIDPKGQIKKDGSTGRKYEWEHAMQQSHVARILLEGMLDPNRSFEAEFDAIMANFKLIGLDYAKNELLKQGGFQLSMTGKIGGKWDILKGTWLSRYFNDIMAELGGIDPNGIMHVSGVTLGQYYNIDTNGNSTKALASKVLNEDFNKMLERVKGVKAEAVYSEDRANKLAGNKGKFKFFIPYSAEDYVGLIYPTLGKGKEGDRNLQWYKDNILDPYAIAINQFEAAKVKTLNDWRNLKKQIKKSNVPLKKDAVRGFNNEEALRVYLWNQNNVVPDTLSKKDTDALVKHVEDNPKLVDFANSVLDLLDGQDYPSPQNDWIAGSLTIDLIDNINTVKRADFLKDWKEAVDVVYSKDNMNKLKAIYGERYTEALNNILYRMETGRNRPVGGSRIENQFMNWVNDSVGTIMFFNTRSALLQTISAVNFINFSDNNPIKAAIAFANQPQFWKDFSDLMNSDFLKSRRSGLKNDVNADEIANAAALSQNKIKAALSAVLKVGFAPTQIADSFAIAIGGASFYRNRINTYKKQGLSEQEAINKAMLDFQEIAEESQQSSRPDRISMQQASGLGRVILAFANTPMQYTRLMKKATLDLVNGRGDWKTNISKILYYGAVQNIIFTALQQALFAMLLDDDVIDDEEENEIIQKLANSSADTILRGSGIGGAAVATIKNIILEAIRQNKIKRKDYTKAALKATTLSPPIDSKLRKLMSAARKFTYKQSLKEMREKGIAIDNPAALAVGQVLSATANLPLDRAILKMNNIKDATDTELKTWQQIALALGYSKWQLGIEDKKSESDTKFEQPKFDDSNFEAPKFEDSAFNKLKKGVAGQANRDGTIEVDPNLTPVERAKTIAHEKQHIKDMKSGMLDYDDKYVYYKGDKHERKNGKIIYKGKSYIEGDPKLPWEKRAYNAEPSTKEIKRKKLYA